MLRLLKFQRKFIRYYLYLSVLIFSMIILSVLIWNKMFSKMGAVFKNRRKENRRKIEVFSSNAANITSEKINLKICKANKIQFFSITNLEQKSDIENRRTASCGAIHLQTSSAANESCKWRTDIYLSVTLAVVNRAQICVIACKRASKPTRLLASTCVHRKNDFAETSKKFNWVQIWKFC